MTKHPSDVHKSEEGKCYYLELTVGSVSEDRDQHQHCANENRRSHKKAKVAQRTGFGIANYRQHRDPNYSRKTGKHHRQISMKSCRSGVFDECGYCNQCEETDRRSASRKKAH
jgi:hypothetical protein